MPWSDGVSDRLLPLPLPFPALGFERNGSLQLTTSALIDARVKAPVLNERIDEFMQSLCVWSLIMPTMPTRPAMEERLS